MRESNLANKITTFCKDYLFTQYKFLNKNWQKYDPDIENSLSLFVAKKNLGYKTDVRDYMNNYEDQLERI